VFSVFDDQLYSTLAVVLPLCVESYPFAVVSILDGSFNLEQAFAKPGLVGFDDAPTHSRAEQ
jgi:hypothetical protein